MFLLAQKQYKTIQLKFLIYDPSTPFVHYDVTKQSNLDSFIVTWHFFLVLILTRIYISVWIFFVKNVQKMSFKKELKKTHR